MQWPSFLYFAGECEASLIPTADMLRKHGIRPILNYAAEDDVSSTPAETVCADTAGEQLCDRNMLPFLKSVADCSNREGKGFVQAKVRQLQMHHTSCNQSSPFQHHQCTASSQVILGAGP